MFSIDFVHIFIFQKYMGGATSHHNVDNKDTPISIGPLKIEIVQGDLTKEQTDAIVNSSNGSLDLTIGILLNTSVPKHSDNVYRVS